MLKSIRLENFKLHEKTTIDAARMTVFIGPNNSGKSSIFQALLALRQALARAANSFLQPLERQQTTPGRPFLFSPGETVDVGDFADVVRSGKNEVSIGATGTIRSGELLAYDSTVELVFDVHIRENKIAYHTGRIKTPFGSISWEHAPDLPPQPASAIVVDGVGIRFGTANDFQLLTRSPSQFPPGTSPAKQADIIQFSNHLSAAPRGLLESLHWVSPLRGFEEWACPLPDQATSSIEGLVLADRAVAIASTLAADIKLKRQVSERLEHLLEIGVDTATVGKRVKIYATSAHTNGSQTLFANEGSGANQLPFIFVPIALSESGETILLSEPEAHLHPKAQSDLTALLLKIAEKQSLQFFLETHSEHILHRLLHAVAKGELKPEDLAIYYFENQEGVSKVERLKVNEHGQVEGGLRGFYDQSLTELSDFLEALKKT